MKKFHLVDQVGGIKISTMQVSDDLYETAAFSHGGGISLRRYNTWDAAETGHALRVQQAEGDDGASLWGEIAVTLPAVDHGE